MTPLLNERDPNPVMRVLSDGMSPFLLVCDHAGNTIPNRLGDLGLPLADREDHIAIDIGAFSLSHWLAQRLNASLIGQAYSRLVIDCNRRPFDPASMPKVSDGRVIPGNHDLQEYERARRISEIFTPYHDAISHAITARRAQSRPTVLCAMHSFTRVMNGQHRSCDIGVIHGPNTEVADHLLEALYRSGNFNVGRNVPYEIDFDGDQTIPIHAEQGGLPYVEVEVCSDLIAECAGQRRIAVLLESAFSEVEF